MNSKVEYSVHEEGGRDKNGNVLPGKEIGKYTSETMLAPTMNIQVGQKRYRVRCVDFNSNTGKRKIIVDSTKGNK